VVLLGAVAMTLWSGYEFLRDVRRHRRTASAAGTAGP
jgi:CDP-diacylglycerol---glycerol-3-phosphate 3-phosphatidyltransferase